MADVAFAAGVSRPTVSRVLSGNANVAEATRRQVMAVAESLGYRPDPLVATLMAQRKSRRPDAFKGGIAVVVYPNAGMLWHQSDFFATYRSGLEKAILQHGYRPDYLVAGQHESDLSVLLRTIEARGIEGIVISHAPAGIKRLEGDFSKFACAYLGQGIREPHFSRVDSHHAFNMRLACETIYARGLQRIGFAGGREVNEKVRLAWLGAYLGWAATTAGIEAPPPLFLDETKLHQQQSLGSLPEVRRWLKRHRPEAVISDNGWLLRLLEQAPDPPKLCALNLEAGMPYCGIDNRHEAIGRAGFELVLAHLHRGERGIPPVSKHVMIEGVWQD